MPELQAVPLSEIQAARRRLAEDLRPTPLLPLEVSGFAGQIYLKLENLQPIGSFKLRGAGNAIRAASPEVLRRGVYTASAGNMAQGVAWQARRLGIPCSVIVPQGAPGTKLAALRRLGAEIIEVPYARWWQVLLERRYPGQEGLFIHPVSDPLVMAGNGTIALEILEQLPHVDVVIAGFGGGGLSCGIASALAALKPQVQVWAAEVETAAPLHTSLRQGRPTEVEHRPSFVDGIGAKGLLPEMWPLVRTLLAGSVVVTLREVAEAIRLLAERAHVVAEGAGAASLAAALSGRTGGRQLVCVVSGGNIDLDKLAEILAGRLP